MSEKHHFELEPVHGYIEMALLTARDRVFEISGNLKLEQTHNTRKLNGTQNRKGDEREEMELRLRLSPCFQHRESPLFSALEDTLLPLEFCTLFVTRRRFKAVVDF